MPTLLSQLQQLYHHLPGKIPEEWGISLLITGIAVEESRILLLQVDEEHEEPAIDALIFLLKKVFGWKCRSHVCTKTTGLAEMRELLVDSPMLPGETANKNGSSGIPHESDEKTHFSSSLDAHHQQGTREPDELEDETIQLNRTRRPSKLSRESISSTSFLSAMSRNVAEYESSFTLAPQNPKTTSGPMSQCLLLRQFHQLPDTTQLFLAESLKSTMSEASGDVNHVHRGKLLIIALVDQCHFESLHQIVVPQLLDATFMTGYWKSQENAISSSNTEAREIHSTPPILTHETLKMLQEKLIPRIYASYDIEVYFRHLLVSIREHPFYGGGLETTCFTDLELGFRTWAWISGYDFIIPEHIMATMKSICLHRLHLRDKSHFMNDPDLVEARDSFKVMDLIVNAFEHVRMPV